MRYIKYLLVTLITITVPAGAITEGDGAKFSAAYSAYQQYAEAGNWEESLDFAKEAWDLSRELNGDGHRTTAKLAHKYALNLAQLGKNGGAKYVFDSALLSYESAYGPSSPELIPLLLDMSDVGTSITGLSVDKKGKRYRSMQLQRALTIGKDNYGNDSPEYAELLTKVGFLYARRNFDKSGAKYLLEKGYKLSKNLEGGKSVLYANSAYALGKYELMRGDADAAIEYLDEAWSVYSGIPVGDTEMQVAVLTDLVRANYAERNAEEVAWYRGLIQHIAPSAINMKEQLIIRIKPERPPNSAWVKKLEWAWVEYTVDEMGNVANPIVVYSSENEAFHASAIEAIKGFFYTPRIENGVAIKIVGAVEKFEFYR